MTDFFKNMLKYFIILFFVLGNTILFNITVIAGEMEMHTINVGRGDSIVITSNGKYMLIDSGTAEASSIVLDYLDKLNIPDKKIDYVVSTHPDGDHIGSFPAVFEKYTVGEIIYSPCPKHTSTYYNFIKAIKKENCPYRVPREGESWNLGDATVKVIYNGSQGTTYNECSIVLKVTCDKKTILLMGDLPSTMERSLLKQGYNFKADVIKIGHHGAAASSCADFLDAVSPKYAVISCADPSVTKLPKPSTLKRLAKRDVKTYRTTDDDVVINFKNGKITTDNIENNYYNNLYTTANTNISLLKINPEYYFQICAYTTNIGIGKWSKTIKIKTDY